MCRFVQVSYIDLSKAVPILAIWLADVPKDMLEIMDEVCGTYVGQILGAVVLKVKVRSFVLTVILIVECGLLLPRQAAPRKFSLVWLMFLFCVVG